MFGYMTHSDIDIEEEHYDITCKGTDMDTLLYSFMHEFLMAMTDDFICRDVRIIKFDRANWTIKARGFGEKFDLKKHEQGTEVKAITYSAMKIVETEEKAEIYLIVDI
jgi:SHS2 domain-containing protein